MRHERCHRVDLMSLMLGNEAMPPLEDLPLLVRLAVGEQHRPDRGRIALRAYDLSTETSIGRTCVGDVDTGVWATGSYITRANTDPTSDEASDR